MMEGPGADSEEKHEPVSDIDTAVVVVGLKALDPEWPIREAIPKPLCATISDRMATVAAESTEKIGMRTHPMQTQ